MANSDAQEYPPANHGDADSTMHVALEGTGFGTDVPQAPLHVVLEGVTFVPVVDTAAVIQNSGGNVRLSLLASAAGSCSIEFGDGPGAVQIKGRIVSSNGTGVIRFDASGSTQHAALNSVGWKVGGAGGSTAASRLDVVGAVTLSQISEPANPAAGFSIEWHSNGTGFGAVGDKCIKSNVGGTTRKNIIAVYATGSL